MQLRKPKRGRMPQLSSLPACRPSFVMQWRWLRCRQPPQHICSVDGCSMTRGHITGKALSVWFGTMPLPESFEGNSQGLLATWQEWSDMRDDWTAADERTVSLCVRGRGWSWMVRPSSCKPARRACGNARQERRASLQPELWPRQSCSKPWLQLKQTSGPPPRQAKPFTFPLP